MDETQQQQETPETPQVAATEPQEAKKKGGKWRKTILDELSSYRATVTKLEAEVASLKAAKEQPQGQSGDGDESTQSQSEGTKPTTPESSQDSTPETTPEAKKPRLSFGPSGRKNRK